MPDDEEGGGDDAYKPNTVTAWLSGILYGAAAILFIISLVHSGDFTTAVRADGTGTYPQPDFSKSAAEGTSFVAEVTALVLCVILAFNHFTVNRRVDSASKAAYKGKADKMDRWHHAQPMIMCSGSPTLFWLLLITLGVLVVVICITQASMASGNKACNGLYVALGGAGGVLIAGILELCLYRRTDNGRHFGPRWQDDQRKKIWISRAFAFKRPKPAKEEEAEEEAAEEEKEEAEAPKSAKSKADTATPPPPVPQWYWDPHTRQYQYRDLAGKYHVWDYAEQKWVPLEDPTPAKPPSSSAAPAHPINQYYWDTQSNRYQYLDAAGNYHAWDYATQAWCPLQPPPAENTTPSPPDPWHQMFDRSNWLLNHWDTDDNGKWLGNGVCFEYSRHRANGAQDGYRYAHLQNGQHVYEYGHAPPGQPHLKWGPAKCQFSNVRQAAQYLGGFHANTHTGEP